MRTVTVGNNQTLMDIAMQVYGSAAGVWLLLQDNAAQVDPQSPFVTPGMVLQVRADVFSQAKTLRQAVKEYRRTGRNVAALNPSALLPNFPYRRCGIGYWRIGVDFVVGGTCGVPNPTVPLPTGVVDQYRLCDGVVTFTANDPGAGYEVQWSLDGFATVAATGLTFSPLFTISPTPIPVYVRVMDTTNFVPSGIVTAFAYVEGVFTITTATTLIELTPTEESIELEAFLDVPFTIARTCCDSPVTLTLVQGPDPEQVEVTLPAAPVPSPFNVRFQPLVTVAADTPFTLELSGSACGTAGITVPGIIRRPPFAFINAWDLDGVNDRVSIPHSATLNAIGSLNFSIAIFVRPFSGQTDTRPILVKRTPTTVGIDLRQRDTPNGNRFRVAFFNGVAVADLVAPTPWTSGRWYHLMLVRDGANATLYVDNVAVATTAALGTTLFQNTGIVELASWVALLGTSVTADTQLDECQIYNRALTSTERAAIYNGGLGNLPPSTALANLVSRHSFDTAVPTGPNFILADSSGNGNNGTSSGISVSPLVPH
jgi:hypothetical protein